MTPPSKTIPPHNQNPCGEIPIGSDKWVYKKKKYHQTISLGITQTKVQKAIFKPNGRPVAAEIQDMVESLVNSCKDPYGKMLGQQIMNHVDDMWGVLSSLDDTNPAKQLFAVKEMNKE